MPGPLGVSSTSTLPLRSRPRRVEVLERGEGLAGTRRSATTTRGARAS